MKSPNIFERMLNRLNAMSDEKKLLGIAIMTGLFLAMLAVLAVTVVVRDKANSTTSGQKSLLYSVTSTSFAHATSNVSKTQTQL